MPGTNHSMETGFLDPLPNLLRPAAADLLQYYRLKQLIEMRKEGPYPELTQRFQLTTAQWFRALDAVILTKVTYFDLFPEIKTEHIKLLLKAIGLAMNEPGITINELLKRSENRYLYFEEWLKKLVEINRVKIALAQQGRATQKNQVG